LADSSAENDAGNARTVLMTGSLPAVEGGAGHPVQLKSQKAKKNAPEPIPAVDKPLHIHRTRCAERHLLKTVRFFSNIGAGSIQSLSSSFSAT
jgi:hypothetical protein